MPVQPEDDGYAAPQERQGFKDVSPTAPVTCLWVDTTVKDLWPSIMVKQVGFGELLSTGVPSLA